MTHTVEISHGSGSRGNTDPEAQSKFRTGVIWNIGSLIILGVSGLTMNVLIDVARGEQALGVFSQCFAFFIVIAQLSVGGLQFSTLKHVSHVQDNLRECWVILVAALPICCALGATMSLLLYTLRGTVADLFFSSQLATGIAWMIPGMFLFSLNKILLMTVNGLRHMRAFAIFQALRPTLILAGIGIVLALDWPDARLSGALSFAEGIVFVGLAAYVWGHVFRGIFGAWSDIPSWVRKHVSFGSRGFLSGVLIELNTRVDVLMIGLVMSDGMVGIYAFGAVFAEGYAQLSNVMRQNIDPIVGKAFAQERPREIEDCGRMIRRNFFPKMLLAGTGLAVGFPVFLHLLDYLFGRQVNYSSYYVLAILVACYALASLYQPFIGLLLQGGKPGTFTLFIVISVIGNILLNMLLIPEVGIYGAAIGTGCIAIFQGFGIAYLGRRILGVRI